MSTMPLFLDQDFKPTFEKLGSSVRLGDDPANWQVEVAAEIYKQLPFLADYAVNVVFDRVSPERGYASGTAEVTNKTDAPLPEQPAASIRIPLIVKERVLQSLDVMLSDGKAYPLNERRVRETLFRTDTFEISTRKPTDKGMVDQLYPPLRTNYGYGNAVATGVGVGGMGKQASLLEAIAPTIPQAEIDQFVAKVASDPETKLLALRNPEFEKAALMLAAVQPVSIEKTAAALVESIPPTVVQFQKLASGDFLVKWANAEAFNPQQGQVDPGTAQGMAGTDKVLGMGPDQTLTVSTDRAKKETLKEEKIEVAQDFGQFRVRAEENGEDLVGWVLPISDFDMQSMPLFLWTDGGEKFSVQAEIAGSRCGHDLNLPATGPQGTGCFYYLDNERARAFLPMTIRNHITDEKGSESFQGETLFGEQITLTPTPGLQATQEIEEGHYAIPEELRWMSLGEALHLVASPDQFDTQDNLQQAPGAVDVKSTGPGEFSMDGAPLAKVARELKTFIKQADAEFLLVAMGLSQFEAREKLAAAKGGYQTVKVAGLRPITPLDVVHRELLKQAAVFLEQFPYGLKRDLIKEAAALEDSETVDSILSMGFINPENIQTFANYMPQLEETAQKLAEMLMAARLGMAQFDEGAIQRAMTNLEEVIQGLRALEQKGLVKA